jgi:hypothetical protein
MNGKSDFDRIAQSWLQDGPTQMPDRSLQAALDEVHVTSQQRFGAARRTFIMNGNAFRLAGAAMVALVIIVAGGIYLGNNSRSGGVGGPPAATAAPTATPSATPAILPADKAVEPGRYRMDSIGLVGGSVPATLSITVPSGWMSVGTHIVGKDYGQAAGAAFGVWQISDRFKQPCTDHTLFQPAPGPSVDELLNTLASQPGITPGPVTDVTVGGYSGKYVELTVATDIATCQVPSGDDALSGFWLWASADGDRRYVQDSDEMDRIYAVDVGGSRFTFYARIPKRTTAADRAELQAMIDSITIEPSSNPTSSGAPSSSPSS